MAIPASRRRPPTCCISSSKPFVHRWQQAYRRRYFVWFLERHEFLYNDEGEKRIADNALVAFTLLVAESKPDEREIMVKVIINLINGKNG